LSLEQRDGSAWYGSCRQLLMMRIAVVTILAIIVHVLLVTSTATATEHDSVGATPSASAAEHSFDTRGDHDARCFVTQPMMTARDLLFELGFGAVDVPNQSRPSPAVPDDAASHPAHPPDVLRALLQVYRI
jgi:hypothetical protein